MFSDVNITVLNQNNTYRYYEKVLELVKLSKRSKLSVKLALIRENNWIGHSWCTPEFPRSLSSVSH